MRNRNEIHPRIEQMVLLGTKVCITKSKISMRTWRSQMSAALQGAFVVIPEISRSDISYIKKATTPADCSRQSDCLFHFVGYLVFSFSAVRFISLCKRICTGLMQFWQPTCRLHHIPSLLLCNSIWCLSCL